MFSTYGNAEAYLRKHGWTRYRGDLWYRVIDGERFWRQIVSSRNYRDGFYYDVIDKE